MRRQVGAERVFLGLGSNLGDKEENLTSAINRIEQVPGISLTRKSKFYSTVAVGLTNQPDFLNAVIEIKTHLPPRRLLNRLLEIEKQSGRQKTEKCGPRIIDLDILLYDNQIIRYKDLIVPHPLMHERRFVLEPLAELAPEIRHPVLNKSVQELLSQCLHKRISH